MNSPDSAVVVFQPSVVVTRTRMSSPASATIAFTVSDAPVVASPSERHVSPPSSEIETSEVSVPPSASVAVQLTFRLSPISTRAGVVTFTTGAAAERVAGQQHVLAAADPQRAGVGPAPAPQRERRVLGDDVLVALGGGLADRAELVDRAEPARLQDAAVGVELLERRAVPAVVPTSPGSSYAGPAVTAPDCGPSR